jgi:hypothetical protein
MAKIIPSSLALKKRAPTSSTFVLKSRKGLFPEWTLSQKLLDQIFTSLCILQSVPYGRFSALARQMCSELVGPVRIYPTTKD